MPLGLSRRDAVVEPYDPNWPLLFEQERRRIMAAVGHIVAGVHHVGSTSIPGMLSRNPYLISPFCYTTSRTESAAFSPMEKIGYLHVGLLDDIPGDRFFGNVHTSAKELLRQ